MLCLKLKLGVGVDNGNKANSASIKVEAELVGLVFTQANEELEGGIISNENNCLL